jgi:hypothetical protein
MILYVSNMHFVNYVTLMCIESMIYSVIVKMDTRILFIIKKLT